MAVYELKDQRRKVDDDAPEAGSSEMDEFLSSVHYDHEPSKEDWEHDPVFDDDDDRKDLRDEVEAHRKAWETRGRSIDAENAHYAKVGKLVAQYISKYGADWLHEIAKSGESSIREMLANLSPDPVDQSMVTFADVMAVREILNLERDEAEAHRKAWDTRGRGQKEPGHNITDVTYGGSQHNAHAGARELFGEEDGDPKAVIANMIQDVDEKFDVTISGETSDSDEWSNGAMLNYQLDSDNARIERTFKMDDGDLVVEHDYFRVRDTARGAGLAKDVMRSSLDEYQRLGVKRIDVTANIDAGAYAWARFGFLPDEHGWSLLKGKIQSRMDQFTTFGEATPEQRELVGKVLASKDPRALWTLVDANVELKTMGAKPQKFARALLFDVSWRGSIDMNNTEQLARYKHFVGKKGDPSSSKSVGAPDLGIARQKTLLGETHGE